MENIFYTYTLTGIDSYVTLGHSNAMDPTAEICEQKEGMQVCARTHTHTHTQGHTSKWHQDWDQIYLATSFLRLSFFCRPEQRKAQEDKEVQRKSYCFFEVICGGVNCYLNVMLFTLWVTVHMPAGMANNDLSPCENGAHVLGESLLCYFFIWKKLTSPFRATQA